MVKATCVRTPPTYINHFFYLFHWSLKTGSSVITVQLVYRDQGAFMITEETAKRDHFMSRSNMSLKVSMLHECSFYSPDLRA